MVRVVDLVKICNLNDVELMFGVVVYDNYAVFGWYSDHNYTSDPYGCTDVPNIFHNWAVARSELESGGLNHKNIFGEECTPYVLWAFVGTWIGCFSRDWFNKNLLVVGGYNFSDYVSRLFIVDLDSMSLLKIIKDSWNSVRNNGASLTCSNKLGKCLISSFGLGGANKGRIYVCNVDDLPKIDDMSSLDVVLDNAMHPMLLNDRIAVAQGVPNTDNAGKTFKIDLSTLSVTEVSKTDIPTHVCGRYGISVVNDTVYAFRLSDLSSLGSAKLPFTISGEWSFICVGDGVGAIVNGTNMALIRISDAGIEPISSVTISEEVSRCDIFKDGIVICGRPGFNVQYIRELVPDKQISLSLSGNNVVARDEKGNPIANLELSVFEMDVFRMVDRCSSKANTCTVGTYLGSVKTDSSGEADLSKYIGKNIIVLPRW